MIPLDTGNVFQLKYDGGQRKNLWRTVYITNADSTNYIDTWDFDVQAPRRLTRKLIRDIKYVPSDDIKIIKLDQLPTNITQIQITNGLIHDNYAVYQPSNINVIIGIKLTNNNKQLEYTHGNIIIRHHENFITLTPISIWNGSYVNMRTSNNHSIQKVKYSELLEALQELEHN
jgi:hypothetical protein